MCDTTAAPSMITKCKPDLPEKIGNHINNFFMQSRKPHHFYLNLINNYWWNNLLNQNTNAKSDGKMCDAIAAPSMITKCKLDLPENIGNHVNNHLMQSRKPHYFFPFFFNFFNF